MNRMGALLTLVISIGIGFILWKALDERLDVRYKLLKRFRIIREKPWLVVAGMMGLILLVGVFFLIFKVPEAVYYGVSGLAITSAIMLISNKNEDFDDDIVKPQKNDEPSLGERSGDDGSSEVPSEEEPRKEDPAESSDTPDEEKPSEEAPAEEEKGAEPAPEEEAPANGAVQAEETSPEKDKPSGEEAPESEQPVTEENKEG